MTHATPDLARLSDPLSFARQWREANGVPNAAGAARCSSVAHRAAVRLHGAMPAALAAGREHAGVRPPSMSATT